MMTTTSRISMRVKPPSRFRSSDFEVRMTSPKLRLLESPRPLTPDALFLFMPTSIFNASLSIASFASLESYCTFNPLVRSNTASSMLMATKPTRIAMTRIITGSSTVVKIFTLRSSSSS